MNGKIVEVALEINRSKSDLFDSSFHDCYIWCRDPDPLVSRCRPPRVQLCASDADVIKLVGLWILLIVVECKPTTKWTFTEVQEAIDEHQREQQVKRPHATAPKAKTLQIATAVAAPDHSELEVECRQMNTAKITPISSTSPNDRTAESGALERMLTMLERVLERTAQPVGDTQPQFFPSSRPTPCQVCGNSNHSTRTHCMRERRCLACLEIGHQRRSCPKFPNTQRVGGSIDQGN
ncbi:uncharacterized protein LOC119789238 [Cyprinodon tularosa]|uniref:uncharacterized protein LOC119789238 n=1 Tax=Cyprinodon tularosa TaxID=77115 RepID=UPI0018E25F59|nr:uncharacterized protein LOC119789238 [Cyprinodon tularosa]